LNAAVGNGVYRRDWNKNGRSENTSKHGRHNGPSFMNITKKYLLFFIIIGILASGIPVISMCSSNCIASDLKFHPSVDGSCLFSFHSFVHMIIVLSALLALPFAGRFLVRDIQFTSPDVYWPLFKPPRFSQ